jgi:hypothetical protein
MHHAGKGALIVLAMALVACSENAVAPRMDEGSTNVSGGGSTRDLLPGDTLRFTITIDPNKSATYDLGNGHSVYFPNGELCDPAKSTYGPTEWNQPCTKAVRDLTVSVTAWIDANGHPYEDFSPSLRFLPTTNPTKFVILSLTDPAASVDLSMDILYCPSTTSACYDEAVNDPTLVTQHDPVTGKVWRRIKHFSGYNVAAGDDSTGIDASMNRIGRLPDLSYVRSADSPSVLDIANVAQRSKKLPVRQLVVAKHETGYILASG